jgi:hypothetical protein
MNNGLIVYITKQIYGGISKSFWTGCLDWELQIVQLSATSCSCIAILWVNLVSFAAITLCVASQQVFVYCCKHMFHYWLSPETFGYTLLSFKYRITLLIVCDIRNFILKVRFHVCHVISVHILGKILSASDFYSHRSRTLNNYYPVTEMAGWMVGLSQMMKLDG